PNDQISRVSGKWTIHFSRSLHGHGESAWPGASGAPAECTHGMNDPLSPKCSTTARPIRVISFMLMTTYAESLSSTPILAIGEPIGPIEYGTTYIVRPRMQPSKSRFRLARISCGSIQLFVGPASSLREEQMNVRSSMRATSDGCERAR